MSYAKKYGLQAGDQIITPLFSLGLSKHFVVYLGFESGIEWIAENQKGYGVRVIPAYLYFRNITIISRIERFRGTNAQRADLIKKAKSLIGTPYDLVGYNCEHFANQLVYSVTESKQINVAIGVFFGLIIFNSLKS